MKRFISKSIAVILLLAIHANAVSFNDSTGIKSYCKVFSTGLGSCYYDTIEACQADTHGSDEVCLPRKEQKKKSSKISQVSSVEVPQFSSRSNAGLAMYLSPETMHGDKLDKTTLYFMQALKVVQKIKGGYLITADPIVWASGHAIEFGVAYLQTDQKFSPDETIFGWVYYVGEFEYTAQNGFANKAPSFRPYKGKQDPKEFPVKKE